LDDKLFGKRSIIVAGASGGIGNAASTKLVELGYQVFGLARSYDKLAPSAPDRPPKVTTKGNGNLYVPIECDITKSETFDNILNAIVSKATGNTIAL
jgi:NADP-dependent 3-hydroxy acid dehydrogenase YdfG